MRYILGEGNRGVRCAPYMAGGTLGSPWGREPRCLGGRHFSHLAGTHETSNLCFLSYLSTNLGSSGASRATATQKKEEGEKSWIRR